MIKSVSRWTFTRLYELCAQGGGGILLYHRVLPASQIDDSKYFSGLEVSVEDFDRHLAFLSKKKKLRSLTEMVELAHRSEISPRDIGISFDDGYLDNLEHALPLLEKYEAPATIFVSTGLHQHPAYMWWYELEARVRQVPAGSILTQQHTVSWDGGQASKRRAVMQLNDIIKWLPRTEADLIMARLRSLSPGEVTFPSMLNDEQLKTLAEHQLIELGAHTVSHATLKLLQPDEVRSEISMSREQLRKISSKEVSLLAYPYGGKEEADEREYALAAEAGFRAAFTTVPDHISASTNPYAVPRLVVDREDNVESLRWKLSGGYARRNYGW